MKCNENVVLSVRERVNKQKRNKKLAWGGDIVKMDSASKEESGLAFDLHKRLENNGKCVFGCTKPSTTQSVSDCWKIIFKLSFIIHNYH